MTSGGNSFNYFPENQLTKFIAVSSPKISMTQRASSPPPRMDAPSLGLDDKSLGLDLEVLGLSHGLETSLCLLSKLKVKYFNF